MNEKEHKAQEDLRECLKNEAKAIVKFAKVRQALKDAAAALHLARKYWNKVMDEAEDGK